MQKNDNQFNQNKVYSQLLYEEVKQNRLESVRKFLSLGVKSDFKDAEENTPLHLAVKNNNEKMLVLLLEYGADLRQINTAAQTPIKLAVKNSLWNCVKIIATARPDTDGYAHYGYALLEAVKLEYYYIAKLLINAGAHPRWVDDKKNSCLHIAVQNKNPLLVALLLLHTISPEKLENAEHETPITLALKNDFEFNTLFAYTPEELEEFLISKEQEKVKYTAMLIQTISFLTNKNLPVEVIFNILSYLTKDPILKACPIQEHRMIGFIQYSLNFNEERLANKYLESVKNSIKEYKNFGGKFRFIPRPDFLKSEESKKFMQNIQALLDDKQQTSLKKEEFIQKEIEGFFKLKQNKKSYAVDLLKNTKTS